MKRENFLYIGVDFHKKTHTAVLVNCWNERLETIEIENKPSEFSKLAKRVNKRASKMGLSPIYGLENAYGYGRCLAVWLIEQGYVVKDVNPALSYEQRMSAPTTEKNDEHDAHCVATVLINNLHKLPNAQPEDAHWTLAQLVMCSDNCYVHYDAAKIQLLRTICIAVQTKKAAIGMSATLLLLDSVFTDILLVLNL